MIWGDLAVPRLCKCVKYAVVVADGGDRNAPGNPFYNTKKESERSGGAGRRHEATRSRGVILEFYPAACFAAS